MSRIFLATEASLNRRVVVRALPPELTSEVSTARFRQEMELLARLQHPHILPILDYRLPRRRALLHHALRGGRIAPPPPGQPRAPSPLPTQSASCSRWPTRWATPTLPGCAPPRREAGEHPARAPGRAMLADFGVARALAAAPAPAAGHATPASPSARRATCGPSRPGRPGSWMPAARSTPSGGRLRDVHRQAALRGAHGASRAHRPPHPHAAASAQRGAPQVPPTIAGAIGRALRQGPGGPDPHRRGAQQRRGAGRIRLRHLAGTPESSMQQLPTVLVAALVVLGGVLLRRPTHPRHSIPMWLTRVTHLEVETPALSLWREGMVDLLLYHRFSDSTGSACRTVGPVPPMIRHSERPGRPALGSGVEASHRSRARPGCFARCGPSRRVGAARRDAIGGRLPSPPGGARPPPAPRYQHPAALAGSARR